METGGICWLMEENVQSEDPHWFPEVYVDLRWTEKISQCCISSSLP